MAAASPWIAAPIRAVVLPLEREDGHVHAEVVRVRTEPGVPLQKTNGRTYASPRPRCERRHPSARGRAMADRAPPGSRWPSGSGRRRSSLAVWSRRAEDRGAVRRRVRPEPLEDAEAVVVRRDVDGRVLPRNQRPVEPDEVIRPGFGDHLRSSSPRAPPDERSGGSSCRTCPSRRRGRAGERLYVSGGWFARR